MYSKLTPAKTLVKSSTRMPSRGSFVAVVPVARLREADFVLFVGIRTLLIERTAPRLLYGMLAISIMQV